MTQDQPDESDLCGVDSDVDRDPVRLRGGSALAHNGALGLTLLTALIVLLSRLPFLGHGYGAMQTRGAHF